MKRPEDLRVFQKRGDHQRFSSNVTNPAQRRAAEIATKTVNDCHTRRRTISAGYQEHDEHLHQVCASVHLYVCLSVCWFEYFMRVCESDRLSAHIHAGLWKQWIISPPPRRSAFKSLNEQSRRGRQLADETVFVKSDLHFSQRTNALWNTSAVKISQIRCIFFFVSICCGRQCFFFVKVYFILCVCVHI